MKCQGGFSPKNLAILSGHTGSDDCAGHDINRGKDKNANSKVSFSNIQTFVGQDTNNSQKFLLDTPTSLKCVKILTTDSTDFYGRIVIYDLKIFGSSE